MLRGRERSGRPPRGIRRDGGHGRRCALAWPAKRRNVPRQPCCGSALLANSQPPSASAVRFGEFRWSPMARAGRPSMRPAASAAACWHQGAFPASSGRIALGINIPVGTIRHRLAWHSSPQGAALLPRMTTTSSSGLFQFERGLGYRARCKIPIIPRRLNALWPISNA
jgi:hypothetical protein